MGGVGTECGRGIRTELWLGDRAIILGRCTTKCRIILKWKKYVMRAWIGFMCLKVGTAEAFFLHYSDNCGCTRNRKTCLVAEELIYIKNKRDADWR